MSTNGCKIDFLGKSFSGSAAKLFVVIVKFIFKSILELKTSKKNSRHKKNHFRRPIFINQQILAITLILELTWTHESTPTSKNDVLNEINIMVDFKIR